MNLLNIFGGTFVIVGLIGGALFCPWPLTCGIMGLGLIVLKLSCEVEERR